MSSMHRMKLAEGGGKGPALALVPESPGRAGQAACVEASAASAASLGRCHTIQRSPLGRSVVTALEAEMDQVCFWRPAPNAPRTCRHSTGSSATVLDGPLVDIHGSLDAFVFSPVEKGAPRLFTNVKYVPQPFIVRGVAGR